MDDKTEPPDDLDIDAVTRALERIMAADPMRESLSGTGTQLRASGLPLSIGLRHTAKGDRRRDRRYALGQPVAAPGQVDGEAAMVMCLDIGRGGALVRITSHRDSGFKPPRTDDKPARWLAGRIIARRGALHHVAFPAALGPLVQGEIDALLATLERRDRRIGAKMARLARTIERRVARLNDHGVTDLLWSDDYMSLSIEADETAPRSLSPASTAFDAILAGWLQNLTRRLAGPALALLVDRNGHVAAASGPPAMAARWRGLFVQDPPFILAARFANQPALALLPPADRSAGDMWLATAPLTLSGRRWGCVAILRPLRPPGYAAPSPAG